jgi:hypothetical protein
MNSETERGFFVKHYVFCAGLVAPSVIGSIISSGYTVCAVIDNDTNKQGTEISGVPVCGIDALKGFEKGADKLYIASLSPQFIIEITAQLKTLGLEEGVDFYAAFNPILYHWPVFNRRHPDLVLPGDYQTFPSSDRIFPISKHNEKRIFRYIPGNYAEEYRSVLEMAQNAGLFDRFIVKTWITDEFSNLHPDKLFFEHEYIPTILTSNTWPPAMIYDCTLWFINFIIEMDKTGLFVGDPSIYNIAYHKGSFVYFDFGSLCAGKIQPYMLFQMFEVFAAPLISFAAGQTMRAFHRVNMGFPMIGNTDIKHFLSPKMKQKYEDVAGFIIDKENSGKIPEACALILEFIESLPKPIVFSKRGDFETQYLKHIEAKEFDIVHSNLKYRYTTEFIRKLNLRSMVDLAGNGGVISYLLNDDLDYSFVIDVDLRALNTLWEYMPVIGKRNGDSDKSITVIPMYSDAAAITANKCDVAVSLSAVHHFVFLQNFAFGEYIEMVLRFTEKYLVVEFVDANDDTVKLFRSGAKNGYEWYTKGNFEEALLTRCDILEQKPTSDTRTVYMCAVKLT